jgi:hypothetical protein
MPCLDAKALEIDPEGMAFLRSVLRQNEDAAAAVPALPEPAMSPPGLTAPSRACVPAKVRRPRRAAPVQPAIG